MYINFLTVNCLLHLGYQAGCIKQATPGQIVDSLLTYILSLSFVSSRCNPKSYLSTFATYKNRLQYKQKHICSDADNTQLQNYSNHRPECKDKRKH